VCHSEAGYDPLSHGEASKLLVEFGVKRAGDAVLPAFAFSMLPKMIPLLSPAQMGKTFPHYVMGELVEVHTILGNDLGGINPFATSGYMYLMGQGIHFYALYYAQGYYVFYAYSGALIMSWAIVVTLPTAAYRWKQQAKNA